MRLWEACFQTLKGINKKQDKGKSHYDINRDCVLLCVFPFFDKINHSELSTKFSAPKCLDYEGMKDPLTHILHFKI